MSLFCPRCRRERTPEDPVCPEHGLYGVSADALEAYEDGPLLGHILDGRYVLMAYIGGGGMGAVYRGRQLSVGRDVAVKVLHASLTATREDRQRFEDEARAISLLQSRHTVTLFDFGVVRDGPLTHMAYMVLEYVEGETIAHRARRGPIAHDELSGILDGVADALDEAHAHGIVHRDIKPANIILSRDHRGAPLVKVIDFGVARFGEGTGHTRTGFSVGTPSYMAPEQFDATGARLVDGRADVYAMGVVCYVLVAGEKPFSSTSMLELAQMHRSMPPPAIPGAEGDARLQAIEGVLHQALAKHPVDRFATMGAFARALRATLSIPADQAPPPPTAVLPIVIGPPPAPTPTESFIGMIDGVIDADPPPRPRRRGGLAVVAVVLLGGAAGALLAHQLTDDDAPRPATQPVIESVPVGDQPVPAEAPEVVAAVPATGTPASDAPRRRCPLRRSRRRRSPPTPPRPPPRPPIQPPPPSRSARRPRDGGRAQPSRPRRSDPRLAGLERGLRTALGRCQCRQARRSTRPPAWSAAPPSPAAIEPGSPPAWCPTWTKSAGTERRSPRETRARHRPGGRPALDRRSRGREARRAGPAGPGGVSRRRLRGRGGGVRGPARVLPAGDPLRAQTQYNRGRALQEADQPCAAARLSSRISRIGKRIRPRRRSVGPRPRRLHTRAQADCEARQKPEPLQLDLPPVAPVQVVDEVAPRPASPQRFRPRRLAGDGRPADGRGPAASGRWSASAPGWCATPSLRSGGRFSVRTPTPTPTAPSCSGPGALGTRLDGLRARRRADAHPAGPGLRHPRWGGIRFPDDGLSAPSPRGRHLLARDPGRAGRRAPRRGRGQLLAGC
ncbi:MAG: serine/threonine-protein kinase [bacterium]